MIIVKPETVDDSVLTSSIAEPDASRGEFEWSAYNKGYFSYTDTDSSVCSAGPRVLYSVNPSFQNVYKITLNQDYTTTQSVFFPLNAATTAPKDIAVVDSTIIIIDSAGYVNFYTDTGVYVGRVSDANVSSSSKIASFGGGYFISRNTGVTKPVYHWCTGLTPASFEVGEFFQIGADGDTVDSMACDGSSIYAITDSLTVQQYTPFDTSSSGTQKYADSVIFSVAFSDYDSKFYVIADSDAEGGLPYMPMFNADFSPATFWHGGDLAVIQSTHDIYQCVTANNFDRPDIGAAKDVPTWIKYGPTNKYAMFDGTTGNQTVSDSGNVTVTLNYPSAITSVCGFNIENCATVAVTISNGTAYNETITIGANKSFSLFGLSGSTVTLVFTPSASPMKIGQIVSGEEKALGESNFGGSVGLLDFSRVENDTFGNTTITPRRKVKLVDYDVTVDTEDVEDTFNFISSITTVPSVYAAESEYTGQALVVFAIYQDFRAVIEAPEVSTYTLSVQGLT